MVDVNAYCTRASENTAVTVLPSVIPLVIEEETVKEIQEYQRSIKKTCCIWISFLGGCALSIASLGLSLWQPEEATRGSLLLITSTTIATGVVAYKRSRADQKKEVELHNRIIDYKIIRYETFNSDGRSTAFTMNE